MSNKSNTMIPQSDIDRLTRHLIGMLSGFQHVGKEPFAGGNIPMPATLYPPGSIHFFVASTSLEAGYVILIDLIEFHIKYNTKLSSRVYAMLNNIFITHQLVMQHFSIQEFCDKYYESKEANYDAIHDAWHLIVWFCRELLLALPTCTEIPSVESIIRHYTK